VFSSRSRHTSLQGDWSSDVCSSDLLERESELVQQRQEQGRIPRRRPDHPRVHELDDQPPLKRCAADLQGVLGLDELALGGELQRSEERRVGKEGTTPVAASPARKKT